MTPAPLQVGQAPSELALNSAGFTPWPWRTPCGWGRASRCTSPGWSAASRDGALVDDHDASRSATEPWISELLPAPATPVTTVSTPSGISTSTFQVVRRRRTSSVPADVRTDSLIAWSSRWRR